MAEGNRIILTPPMSLLLHKDQDIVDIEIESGQQILVGVNDVFVVRLVDQNAFNLAGAIYKMCQQIDERDKIRKAEGVGKKIIVPGGHD
jgi:hypothetical protein